MITVLCLLSLNVSFAQLSEAVDRLFREWDNDGSPGLVVGVVQEGKLVYNRSFGMANLNAETPITPDTRICIGSVSKQITAACIAILAEEGRLDLEADIKHYLPELDNFNTGINIRQLLDHTSGIRDYSNLMFLQGKNFDDYVSREEVLELLTRQKDLNFHPGDQSVYSNSGYFLLGEIVQRVSGKSLQEFADEKLFQPLGMKRTAYQSDIQQITGNGTVSYRKDATGKWQPWENDFGAVANETILTSLNDLCRWVQHFPPKDPEGAVLLKLIRTPSALNNGEPLNYVFGQFLETYRGLKTIRHGGGMLGFQSELLRFPEKELTVIVLANANNLNARAKAFQVADILLSPILKTEVKPEEVTSVTNLPTVALSRKALKTYCGPFWNTKINKPRYIYLREDTIRYNRPDSYESPMVPVGEHEFRVLDGNGRQIATVNFVFNGAGGKDMYFQSGNAEASKSYWFEFPNYKTRDLLEFDGKYYNEELDLTYELKLEGKDLMLYQDGKKRSKLSAVKTDYFTDNFYAGDFEFKRDVQGRIRELFFSITRVRNLRFEKIN